ncbi:MAG: glycosyltransferase family 4 protein [Lachnospiraceae bacterium]|nr:glycosyltransferase family 4 protein [Lachnospiraceae bacterium]
MEGKKVKIWFLNQNSYMPEDGPHIRHYALGKYLARQGYEPYVFAGNELHHVGKTVDTHGKDCVERVSEGVHFYYVKTTHYEKNNYRRILNILSYYRNVFKVCKKIAKKNGTPDVIYASSMYPTALVAGIKLAKKYGVKCICEHRDLVPEGFITNGAIKANGFIAKGARWFMKKTYEKADALVFTFGGGKKYLIEQKLDTKHGGKVDLSKVFYINNGVDLAESDYDAANYVLADEDLDDPELFKVVYLGSIRFMNQMPLFLEMARALKSRGYKKVKILMWGAGTKLEEMRNKLKEEGLNNIVFKGYVEKKYIAGIAKRADLFIGTGNSVVSSRYGMSFNKLFDYLAAGKPIILPFTVAYSIVEGSGAGVELSNPSGNELADAVIRFSEMPKEEYERYCENARNAAAMYDYRNLSKKIDRIIKSLDRDGMKT